MPSGLTVRLMDIVARIVVLDSVAPAIAREIADSWRDLEIGDDVPHDFMVAVVPHVDATSPESELKITVQPLENLGERLASLLTTAALERMSGRGVMLHASAIALDDGGVVGFVGPSGRGKTTAMTVLAQTHRYVTDEALVIASDLSVTPYPKPLLIGRRPQVKQAYAASSLGLRPASATPLHLACLALLDRRDTGGPLSVTDVPMTEAIVELAQESSYLSALDEPLHTLANLLVAAGGVQRLTYTEATTLPAALDELMRGPSRALPEIRSVAAAPATGSDSPGWSRAPYADALIVDDQLVVMHEQTITVLDGVAPTLWQAAAGVSIEQLTQAVLRAHPVPPDIDAPEAAVASVADELAKAGLLHHT